ncbi:VWA domain-containing protein, partial [Desulfosarcina sp. OttesenSCG-928-B08]|nr:VWA domain-containing protein [Desulfosarcina sp. OttesenSCG-928-B08]
QTPFGRRFFPEQFGPFHTTYQRMAAELSRQLQSHAIQVFRSDLYSLLEQQNGQISATDLGDLILPQDSLKAEKTPDHPMPPDLSELLSEILNAWGMASSSPLDLDGAAAFRYPEWDDTLGDYLPDRTRLLEREVAGADTGFYEKTLDMFHGLVRRIRYAFDFLRPEEMTLLRQWREGDAFDYRALLDYAIDKKAGRMPSDRLYIKRIKRIRDVATLLLVDLSKSTANSVEGTAVRVLDVEKQAIVLLCEALTVVGDRFAIAGFSGNGPLGVDYYRIKDIDMPLDDRVKRRINAMAPQRNTRMGAAIRHATACFRSVEARVRLMMILGDGFPNDLEYKGVHAVEDTRRAVMEARTAGIHVKAITVNVSDNGQLDRLYGSPHHTLIADIRDLPDKLVRVYSALTRH